MTQDGLQSLGRHLGLVHQPVAKAVPQVMKAEAAFCLRRRKNEVRRLGVRRLRMPPSSRYRRTFSGSYGSARSLLHCGDKGYFGKQCGAKMRKIPEAALCFAIKTTLFIGSFQMEPKAGEGVSRNSFIRTAKDPTCYSANAHPISFVRKGQPPSFRE